EKSADRIDGAMTAPTLSLLLRHGQLDRIRFRHRPPRKRPLAKHRPRLPPGSRLARDGPRPKPAQGDPFLRGAQRAAPKTRHAPHGGPEAARDETVAALAGGGEGARRRELIHDVPRRNRGIVHVRLEPGGEPLTADLEIGLARRRADDL